MLGAGRALVTSRSYAILNNRPASLRRRDACVAGAIGCTKLFWASLAAQHRDTAESRRGHARIASALALRRSADRWRLAVGSGGGQHESCREGSFLLPPALKPEVRVRRVLKRACAGKRTRRHCPGTGRAAALCWRPRTGSSQGRCRGGIALRQDTPPRLHGAYPCSLRRAVLRSRTRVSRQGCADEDVDEVHVNVSVP
jgi:hypothetical protein